MIEAKGADFYCSRPKRNEHALSIVSAQNGADVEKRFHLGDFNELTFSPVFLLVFILLGEALSARFNRAALTLSMPLIPR